MEGDNLFGRHGATQGNTGLIKSDSDYGGARDLGKPGKTDSGWRGTDALMHWAVEGMKCWKGWSNQGKIGLRWNGLTSCAKCDFLSLLTCTPATAIRIIFRQNLKTYISRNRSILKFGFQALRNPWIHDRDSLIQLKIVWLTEKSQVYEDFVHILWVPVSKWYT